MRNVITCLLIESVVLIFVNGFRYRKEAIFMAKYDTKPMAYDKKPMISEPPKIPKADSKPVSVCKDKVKL